MELKDGMTVIAPCGCDYIKKGQEFVVTNVKKLNNSCLYSFDISIDGVDDTFCILKYSAHINQQNWIIKPE
jgi:hypothetical protein